MKKYFSSIILTCALIILYAFVSTTDTETTIYTNEVDNNYTLTAGVITELSVANINVEKPTTTTLYAGITRVLATQKTPEEDIHLCAGVSSAIYESITTAEYVSANNIDIVASSYEDDTIIIVGDLGESEPTTEEPNVTDTMNEETTETITTLEPGRTESGAYIVTGRSFSTIEEWEFDVLCHLVTGEAQGENDQAQIAVAQVVLNRMESHLFPSTVYNVIYQNNPVQFSPTIDGNINKTPDERCIANVKKALTDVFYPKEMLFFTSTGYTRGYTDYTKIDDMYFSLCYK